MELTGGFGVLPELCLPTCIYQHSILYASIVELRAVNASLELSEDECELNRTVVTESLHLSIRNKIARVIFCTV